MVLVVAVVVAAATSVVMMQGDSPDEISVVPTGKNWDMTTLFADDEAFYAEVDRINIEDIPVLRDLACKVNTADGLLAYLEYDDRIIDKKGMLKAYAILPGYLDVTFDNSEYRSACESVENNISYANSVAVGILLSSSTEYRNAVLSDERFSSWTPYLEMVFEYEDDLSDEVKELIDKMSQIADNTYYAYVDLFEVDVEYPMITSSDGTTIEADYDGYVIATESDDRQFREDVRKAYFTTLGQYDDTIATVLDMSVTSNESIAVAYGYDNAFDMAMTEDGIDPNVFSSILDVSKGSSEISERYFDLLADELGYDIMPWDIYQSVSNVSSGPYTVEDAEEIILKALEPFGEEYLSVVRMAFDDGWMDLDPSSNKITPWFVTNPGGTHPWICGSWDGTYYSLSSLAHEIGHAVNCYLLSNNVHTRCNNASNILSEVPSLMNEVMLVSYLADTADNDQNRLFYLGEYVELAITNYVQNAPRLILEYDFHQSVIDGNDLTANYMSSMYIEGQMNIVSGVNWNDGFSQYGWINSIDYFSGSYCNSKYVLSIMITFHSVDSVLEGGLDNYITFLSSGTMYDLEENCELLGIDLRSEEFQRCILEYSSDILDEMESISD